MTNLVTMKGIEKRFPGVHALSDVHFDLRAGEVHALMGENGAGKSTLMKVLSGVYQPDGGEVSINGELIDFEGPRAAQEAGICIIHQELSLMNDLTAAQNIFIGREPRGMFGILDEAKLNADAAEIFAQMNLDLSPTVLVEQLTIAKQQMIEIAKALSFESRVLVMDEPTAALNDTEIAELFTIVRALREKGVGIIYISHKMDELKQIADRVTVMRDGASIGTVEAATTPINEIISMMVGRALDNEDLDLPDLTDAPVVLEVENLKRGKDIRGVSFDLRKGEILGLSGLMGAGRTEVARAVFGADPKEAGVIRMNGLNVTINSPADAVAHGIGYLSEDRKHFGLATGMDVRANIVMTDLHAFANKIGVLNEAAMGDTALDYIGRLDIRTPSDRQEVRLLSGGNQQKIVIAKWLLRDCDVLIFDEPTRGIDVGAKSEIYKLLAQLAHAGKAIIVISSELPEVLRLSHRIAVMCEGHLTGILERADATQENIMKLATQTDTAMQGHVA